MRIFKCVLSLTYKQVVEMPRDAKLLDAQIQNGVLAIWFLCDQAAPITNREIAIYGTGNPLPSNDNIGVYVATVQTGHFVWHVFDLGQSWLQ